MSPLTFNIKSWNAWAPGLTEETQWVAWAKNPWCPAGTQTPELPHVAPQMRRRIERLGRMAFHAAAGTPPNGFPAEKSPLIFASRHGDAARSVKLLSDLAAQLPLSPASFALSVHNGAGAQYAIAQKDKANLLAISNGYFTTESAIVEAVALLADGALEVRVVVYDESPTEFHRSYIEEPAADFAFCAVLENGTQFSIAPTELQLNALTPSPLPHALKCLQFLVGTESQMINQQGKTAWEWRRHAQ
jgi:hypothetical protein